MHFCWQPHRARAFARRYLYASASDPTAPAPAALLPRPGEGGGVRAWRYQVSSRARGGAGGKSYPGWSRWETVSGSFPPIPWHWTVGISPRGVGLTGRGNLFPLPCLSRSNHLASRRHPLPRLRRQATQTLLPAAPTPPAPAALLPRPRRGSGVRAWRYLVGSRARGGAGGKSVSGSFPPIPCALDRGAYAIGGGGLRGGGTLPPSPVPCAPQISHISATLLVLLAGIPRPALDDPPVSSRIKRTL